MALRGVSLFSCQSSIRCSSSNTTLFHQQIAMTVDSRHKYKTPSSSSSTAVTNKMGIKKAELAYMLLWLFMLLAWSAILIGLVFTFRVNRHHCENCRSQTLCRDTTPAWGGEAIQECRDKDLL